MKHFAYRWALVAVAAGFGVAPAYAQDDDRNLKPELMLVIDGSASMHGPALAEGDACLPRAGAALPAPAPVGNQRMMSRMNLLKAVLTGTPEPIEQYACMAEPAAIDPRYDKPALAADRVAVNRRSLCCTLRAGPACAVWRPCADDSATYDDQLADPDLHIRRDGLIVANESRIKFGLMTSDGDPSVAASYGAEHDAIQVDAALAAQADVIASGVRRPNLGVRPPTAAAQPPVPGALISGHRGVVNDGNLRPDVSVGEDPDSVRRHNAFVLDQLRAFVPEGPTPTAAMLADMVTYYDRLQNGGDDEADPAFECRRRVAVLFTDGGSTEYYRDPTADAGADPCVGDCRREGFPYQPPSTYIARLAEQGVELYVIGFDHPEADEARSAALGALVAAGDPEEGRDDRDVEDVYFAVDGPEALRNALNRISSSTLAGLRSRTRPLVVTPTEADKALDDGLEDAEQIRLLTYSEVPPGDAGGRYGRIRAIPYACADAQDVEEGRRVPLEAVDEDDFIDFDDVLAEQDERRSVAGDPGGDGVVGVLGGDDALFGADGDLNPGGALDEDQVRELVDVPAGDGLPVGQDPLADVANALDGFFGGAGIVTDEDGNEQRGRRQLGEIYDGDLIAVPPPRLTTENPAFQTHARERRDRPTLIAAGARDGQIHFFRLANPVEAFTFIPRLSWRNLRDGVDNPGLGALNADGPLVYGDIARCRSLGEGNADCPAEDGAIDFRSLVVGGLGSGGPNLFGIDLTEATAALSDEDPGDRIDGNAVRAWDVVNEPQLALLQLFRDTTRQEDRLGLTVSRPLLSHVRVDDQVRAVVVVGCGDDRNPATALVGNTRGEGRCVLVLDAVTGETIRRFDQADGVAEGFTMGAPMVGTPVGFPAGGIQAADRIYIGDRIGQLWRIDLRDPDADDWSMRVVWPPEDAEAAENYRTGRPLVDRPSVSLREDGRLVVVFGTGADPRPAGEADAAGFPRAHVVSFTEQVVLGDGEVDLLTETNWVLPLREQEYLSGAPITSDGIVYFTTIEEVPEQACGNRVGRLYGLDYVRTEEERYVTRDGRTLNVVPGLPTFLTEGGQIVDDAVSVQLPPGRTAYGLTVATAPSCADGDPSTTQLIINMADESQGASGDVDTGGLRPERKQGELVDDPLDESIFDSQGLDLALDLNGLDGDGNPLGRGLSGRTLFPREAIYWGTTFGR